MLLLIGLGNPGAKYQGHRHNLGFMAADAIAHAHRFGPWRRKFRSDAAEGVLGGVKTLLLKPQTWYNESGAAAGEAAHFHKIPPQDVVVFHDEIDLAPGRVRMKAGGGAAGNNGVRSMIAHVGEGFRRARLGIGHPGHKDLVQGHVLSNFAKAEEPWVQAMLGALAQAAPMLAAGEDERFQTEVMRLAPAAKAATQRGAEGAPEDL